MLSMKTLRVAIVTIGSVLLLGSGSAIAYNIDLNSRVAADRAPVPYALETLGSSGSAELPVSRVKYYGLANPVDGGISASSAAGLTLTVTAQRRIAAGEDVYIRVALGDGLVFSAPATVTPVDDTVSELVSGGAGTSFVVYKLGQVDNKGTITVTVDGNLSVVAAAGSYSVSITAHSDPDDATAGVGARSTLFAGSGPIVNIVSGLDVRVVSGAPAVAHVSTGFLWFVGPNAAAPVVAQKNLGWFSVAARQFTGGVTPLDAGDGDAIDAGTDLIAGEGGVGIDVEGNLSVGAFSFIDGTAGDAPNTATGIPDLKTGACPGAGATEASPDRGTLMDEDGELLVGEEGEAATATSGSQVFDLGAATSVAPAEPAGAVHHVYALCVNVDVLGKETNSTPIPIEEYTGTVSITGPSAGADPQEVATGTIGRINRNGAAVEIAYLTVSKKYNQRLIIANRGNTPAMFDLGGFTTEDGTTADLSTEAKAERAAGLHVVPAKGQLVLRVADLLEFSGDQARAAATLSLNARSGHIQVATTQVNLEDGSTDTVVYMTEGGSGI